MKKLFFLPALLLSSLLYSQDKAINGAYKIVKAFYGNDKESYNTDSTTIIKIFRDGYWMGAFFGNPKQPFNGCGGGTYTTKKGKNIETLNFKKVVGVPGTVMTIISYIHALLIEGSLRCVLIF